MAKFLTVTIDETSETVEFRLGDGSCLHVNVQALPMHIQCRALLHGINQKVRDAAAGFTASRDFRGAYAAMERVITNLKVGVWVERPQVTDLAIAIATIKGIDVDAAVDIVKSLDDVQLARVKAHPRIKTEMLRLKLARVERAKGDSDDLGI